MRKQPLMRRCRFNERDGWSEDGGIGGWRRNVKVVPSLVVALSGKVGTNYQWQQMEMAKCVRRGRACRSRCSKSVERVWRIGADVSDEKSEQPPGTFVPISHSRALCSPYLL